MLDKRAIMSNKREEKRLLCSERDVPAILALKMWLSDSRLKLVAGFADGYSGHMDGRLKEARINHLKGLTLDDRRNTYIVDTDKMAIRDIIDTGIMAIARGKKGRGGGHVDGPSEKAKFLNDSNVVA